MLFKRNSYVRETARETASETASETFYGQHGQHGQHEREPNRFDPNRFDPNRPRRTWDSPQSPRKPKPPPTKTVNEKKGDGKPARIAFPYEERIAAIMKFFGISRPAAGFIYHRKMRGYPFKKPTDDKFLEWNLRLQNALVKADECIGWDWDEIHFGKEEQQLAQHDIQIDKQSEHNTYKNESKTAENPNDGWTVVKSEKMEKYRYTKTLQLMGFIQRNRRTRLSKGVERPASDDDSDSDCDSDEQLIDVVNHCKN